MKNQDCIDKLKRGVCVDLDWYANNGKNIGYRIWVDKDNKAVFTEMDSGENDFVIPLIEEQKISDKIDDLVRQGYGA